MSAATTTDPALAYVGLGSNLGDREAMLRAALDGLGALGRPDRVSSVYETEPFGVPGPQPPYLNQVCRLSTALLPGELLRGMLEIEESLGRGAHRKNEPRLIDLDLLFYDGLIMDAPGLSLPHPRLHERAFVLVPLAEIAPGLVHPELDLTVQEMLEAVDASGVRHL